MQMTMLRTALIATLVEACSSASWTRGSFGVLSLSYGGGASSDGYTFTFGSGRFLSTPGSLSNATAWSESSGVDYLGSYDMLTGTWGSAGALSLRYYESLDAFVFSRGPIGQDSSLPTSWPSFEIMTQPENAWRCIGWGERFFFPGEMGGGQDLSDCGSGGPLFIHDRDGDTQSLPFLPRATFALTPLSHFTSNAVGSVCPTKNSPPSADCAVRVDAAAYGCGTRCAWFNTSALLLARPGLMRGMRATGSILRKAMNATRTRGAGVNKLSAWFDNQSGYSFWSVGNDQSAWGLPEKIYLRLKAGYDAAGIPIRGWEPDNNFHVDYAPVKHWIGNDFGTFNESLYPSGGQAWVHAMGNLSNVYYSNGFASDTVYRRDFNMVSIGSNNFEPHPNDSYKFYSHAFSNATQLFGMKMLFTDYLCYRGPSMAGFQDVEASEEGEHLWLRGLTLAAGVEEVQYCMSLAHQILASLEWPAVTNARSNGDGGLDTPSLVLTSILSSLVGLGWSKDNLRTAERCYNSALWPNGTVKFSCDAENDGEPVNGAFVMQEQQTALAALSMGPVGIADQLSSHPDDPSANITSNATLVMATCSATGDLLQPSFPITPIERMLVEAGGFGDCFDANHRPYTFGCGTNVWATYSAIPSNGSVALYYQVLAFNFGRGKMAASIDVFESDIAPMVDASALPSTLLDDIPRGAFSGGSGTSFPADAAGGFGHVVWAPLVFLAGGCENAVLANNQGNVTLFLGPEGVPGSGAAHAFFAPKFPTADGGSISLLGETGKVVPVSTFRFASINFYDSTLELTLRGSAGEAVQLLFAVTGATGAPACAAIDVQVGPDGIAAVTFP